MNTKTSRRIQRKKLMQVRFLNYSSFDNTRAFPLQQKVFTNDRLHIFWVVVDIEEVTSSQGIVQGFLKGSQVIKNFWSNESSKLAAPKTFVFIENFTAGEREKSISSVCSEPFKATWLKYKLDWNCIFGTTAPTPHPHTLELSRKYGATCCISHCQETRTTSSSYLILFLSNIKCLLLHFVHWLRDFCPEVIDNSIQLVKSKLLPKKKKVILY